MKYRKKKEKNSKLPMVLLCAAVLLAAGAAVWYFLLGGSGYTEPTEPTGAETTGTLPGDAAAQEMEVVTGYGTFVLSGSWHGRMRAEVTGGEVCTISVYGQVGSQQEQHVFDVYFGGTTGELVGYVTGENGKSVAVHIAMSDFEPGEGWSETEKQEFYGMQSEVNSIIGALELTADGGTGTEDLLVQTPYMPLAYPGTWGDRVRAEVSGDAVVTVRFYGTPTGMEEQHLFDLVLNGGGENTVGICTTDAGEEITVEITAVSDGPGEGWDDQAAREMNAMIEGINHILSALESGGNFHFS